MILLTNLRECYMQVRNFILFLFFILMIYTYKFLKSFPPKASVENSSTQWAIFVPLSNDIVIANAICLTLFFWAAALFFPLVSFGNIWILSNLYINILHICISDMFCDLSN